MLFVPCHSVVSAVWRQASGQSSSTVALTGKSYSPRLVKKTTWLLTSPVCGGMRVTIRSAVSPTATVKTESGATLSSVSSAATESTVTGTVPVLMS